jgi:hypothetical protein
MKSLPATLMFLALAPAAMAATIPGENCLAVAAEVRQTPGTTDKLSAYLDWLCEPGINQADVKLQVDGVPVGPAALWSGGERLEMVTYIPDRPVPMTVCAEIAGADEQGALLGARQCHLVQGFSVDLPRPLRTGSILRYGGDTFDAEGFTLNR